MAGAVEECIFCERVHRGLCAEDKPKPAPKKRTPKTPKPTPAESPELLDHVVKLDTSGPAPVSASDPFENTASPPVARWAGVAANQLTPEQAALSALAGIMHPNDLEKHGLRRPSRPQITARIAAWKERHRGS